jgi:hypothetical protein
MSTQTETHPARGCSPSARNNAMSAVPAENW